MSAETKPTGVLLLAFGGADSIEDVEPFVKRILSGRPVSRELIEDAKERYRLIGGSSPLLKITSLQARALEERLNREENGAYKVYVGMRYSRPFIRESVARMKADGIARARAVVMAPHTTEASTGGYVKAVKEAIEECGGVPEVEFVGQWHTHPLFIELLTDKISEVLGILPGKKDDFITIFSAHSLPLPSLKNDPYVEKIKQTIEEVLKRLPLKSRMAFQSKGGGRVEWVGPSVEEVIDEAASLGKKGVLVVPVGFVSDHVETLYDVDILFREKTEAAGMAYARSASLNTSPKFIEVLADVVKGAQVE